MTFNPETHTVEKMTCTPNQFFVWEYLAAASEKNQVTWDNLSPVYNIGLWYRFPCSTPLEFTTESAIIIPEGSQWRYTKNILKNELKPCEDSVFLIYHENIACSCECTCRCECAARYSDWKSCCCCEGDCTHPDYAQYNFNFVYRTDGTFSAIDSENNMEAVLCIPNRYIPGDEAYITALGTFRIKRRAVCTIEAAFLAYKYRPGGEVYREASGRYAARNQV